MGVAYYFWKIWLWVSKSNEDEDTIHGVELLNQSTVKTNKDIAERLAHEGVEVKYGALTYIIDQYDRIVRDLVCEGYTVKTNNVQFNPELSGEWSMGALEFDSEKHKCTVRCVPTLEMQRAVGFVGVKVLGFKNTNSDLSQVVDVVSGEVTLIDDHKK